MDIIYPPKLKSGDLIRVIAPSRSLRLISEETQDIANKRLNGLNLKLSFSKHVLETDEFSSTAIESRLEDLHEAFMDPQVSAIISVIGGFNSNQLLKFINYDLIRNNPKILCGYSDITALNNAISAKTGLVTYSGPHYSTFGQKLYFDYTLDYFRKCLMSEASYEIKPSDRWSDDLWFRNQNQRNLISNSGWLVINVGEAAGKILGANLCTFNLLQGTEYFPDLAGSILFLEDDSVSQPHDFDRDLQSVIHQPKFSDVRGLVVARFQKESHMTEEKLIKIIKTKKELYHLPIVADVDFGHTDPKITFPIGGTVSISANQNNPVIKIVTH